MMLDSLFVADKAVVLEALLHFVGHQKARSSSPDMNDTQMLRFRMPLFFDFVILYWFLGH